MVREFGASEPEWAIRAYLVDRIAQQTERL